MGNFIGQLLAPINAIFHPIFFLPVFNILMLIYQAFNLVLPNAAFALSIVALTLLLRSCMIPLTRKQLRSSRAMQELQPRLKQLQAEYRGDPQGMMAAQQALYKEHGVSPVSGCLPLIVQMPFLYALFFSFEAIVLPGGHLASIATINSYIYPFLPKLMAEPQTAFFWADLGKADPLHILPVLAAFLTLIQTRMAMPVKPKRIPGAPSDPTTQATSTMMYIMPAITLLFAWQYAAGLALYWCVSTLFSAVQQYFISGWGSLFVGIPGMEHLVPEPKTTTAAPAANTFSTSGRVATGSARALAPAPPEPKSSGRGFGGMLRQLRESMGAATAQAQQQQQARAEGKVVDADPAKNSGKTGTGTSSPAPRSGRPRSSKAGPVLVKSETRAKADQQPEVAIAHDGIDTRSEESEPLPEVAIARAASGSTNGPNGVNKANGVNGASNNTNRASGSAGAKRAASSATVRPANTPRKTGSGTQGKNSSSARSRSGRAKGGR